MTDNIVNIGEITVPKELLIKSSGLGFDFGGSVIKIVYRTQEDYIKACDPNNTDELAILRVASFAREERKRALEFVRDNAYIIREKDELPSVFTTGGGCTEYTEEIKKICQIKPQIITENDCFAKSFHYFAHRLSRDQLLHPIPYDVMDTPLSLCEELHPLLEQVESSNVSHTYDLELIKQQQEAIRQLRNTDFENLPKDCRPVAEAEDIFPCLIVICGSGFGCYIVTKDGHCSYVDGTQLGGRFFYGIGSLLTGCKNYDELIEMAAKGNHKKVDTQKNDMLFKTGKDNMAAKFGDMKTDFLLFNFGKAVGKNSGDFEPADVASALLRGFVKEKAERARLVAAHRDIKHIFFLGSFVNHEIVRRTYTEILTFANYFLDAANSKKFTVAQYDFVKHGSHFGALGCMVHSVEPFI